MPRSTLPTGLVTFMFSDIEGSTRLLQDLGARYEELLARHDDLLRRAIEDHEGVEVNTEGDAFFAVFSSPQAAVEAAVQAQRALAAQRWPDEAAVRVRIGLHTGEGSLGGKDYLGLDVHRAARVAGAAHGGQVLLSEATRALLDPGASPGLGFRDLGAHRLKDVDRPVRLYQLEAEGLPDSFPPPRARRLGALPGRRTSFIGRSAELDELRGLLAGTRLLVLTGPGGSGKTRMALELAHQVTEAFPDGAWFVPLETITDVRLVPSAVLAALDVKAGARAPDEVLRETLAPLEALLVLDNVEQIEGIGKEVDGLLQAAPRLSVLATSRAALRLYGEQEYRVPPLGLPTDDQLADPGALAASEGVALFVERARAARPEFRLTASSAAAVAEICRRLDGLPLAIELAAARVRMLSPEAILARLDRRLKLLEDDAPNLPARQRSIRGAIEWSHGLLETVEQRLFADLGVFVGGWDLAAAEMVCGPHLGAEVDVLDVLGSLLDKSLIVRADAGVEPRFTMLQTIAEFARERLSGSTEAEVVARRHAEHFRQLVEAAEPAFVGADPAVTVARILPDQDNIRAALAWAMERDAGEVGLALGAAVWRLWQLRGQLAEGRRSLEGLLALRSAEGATALRARALTALGGILYWQGEPAARDRYEEALAIHRSLRDEAGIAGSLSDLGFAALTASPPDPERARSSFEDSLRRYEALGDARMVASVTGSLGYTQMALGNADEAVRLLERALALNEAGGFRARAADNRFALGNLHRRTGRFPEAAAMYRAALAEAVEMGDEARKLTFLSAAASWAAEAGHPGEALRLHGAVRQAAEEQGGTLSGVPGLIDPVPVARGLGLDEASIAAEIEAGSRLASAEAVTLAETTLSTAGAASSEAPGA